MSIKEGRSTSEYSLSIKSIIATVVTILGIIIANGLIPPDSVYLGIATSVMGIAASFGFAGTSKAYTAGRSAVKVADTMATKQAATPSLE